MKRRISAILLILFLAACHQQHINLDPNKRSDSELYQLGMQYMQKKDYSKARDAFKVVFENFPKSDNRILAKIGYADSYYKEGGDANYLLAISEYQDFISLFPFSPKAEYAQYMVGMCYYHMMEKPDRDQTNTKKAVDEFRKVVDNYPSGQYYKEAYAKLVECYSRLANHDYMIARYYDRTGKYQAAVERVKALLKQYPESVHNSAQYYTLAHSLEQLEQFSESCTYYGTLLNKWPNAEESKDAKEHQAKVCGDTHQTAKSQTQ